MQRGDLQALNFTGELAPGKDQELNVQLLMDHFDLRFIDPYLPPGMSDIQGTMTGSIGVTGKLNAHWGQSTNF